MAAFTQWEGSFLLWIQEFLRQPWLDPIVSFYTKLGDAGLLWIVLTLAMLIFPKTRRAGLAGAMALVFSLIFTNGIIKPLLSRTRPWLVMEGLNYLVYEKDPNSFPSGHSSASFAAASAWWGTLPRKWMKVTGMVAAALLALSRLYVGVHFPSDVVCGTLVGLFCGWLACTILRAVEKRRAVKRAETETL